jgi:hypothetical protein
MRASDDVGRGALDEISTRWTQIKDPVQFVLRYSRAIAAYLQALLKQPHDADDVSQQFVMEFLQRGLAAADPDRGRFRDYLKVAVRRAAWAHLRRQGRDPTPVAGLAHVAAAPDEADAEARWREEWRVCLVDRAWRGIESHVRKHPGCGFDVALAIAREQPELDSTERAKLAADRLGRPITAAAYRQMLQRGRTLLKEQILLEVSKTLREPTPEAIDEELADLGLLSLVRESS